MSVKLSELSSQYHNGTLENLETLIKNIAHGHASEINNEEPSRTSINEFSVEDVVNQLVSYNLFESLDKAIIDQGIEVLNKSLENVLSQAPLVKNQGIGKRVPLVYETLSLIFAQTDERFRQKYLHELMEFYYSQLLEILEKDGSTFVLERLVFDRLFKSLLPVVKIEILLQLVKDGDDAFSQKLVSELASNVSNYFNYPLLNQEDIYAIIRNKIDSNNFELISFELVPLVQKNGHLGDYFQLHIEIDRQNVREKLDLFAKFIKSQDDKSLLQSLMKLGPSKKEEFFYMVYLPKLKELGLSELLDFAPNCYFSRVDDVLILDDLTLSGFVGLTPNTKLQYDALKLTVRQVAKLHACSLILEETLSKKEGKPVFLCDLYGEFVQEIIFLGDFMKQAFDHSLETMVFLALQFPDLAGKYSEEELRERARNGWRLALEKVKKSDKFRNVIGHGDLYVANMLFNFDENKHCRAVNLIDFQILRYCLPTQDLLFFLYQNSFKDVLDEHINELLDEYYDSLSTYLGKFNLDITQIYPRKDFDESVTYMKPGAVFYTSFYLPMQMLDPKVRENIFEDPEELKKLQTEKFFFVKVGLKGEAYTKAMRGLVEQFIALCDSGEI